MTTKGKEVTDTKVIGVYDHIIDAVDAYYNHGWARWYTKELMPEGDGQ